MVQGTRFSILHATTYFLKNLTLIPSWAVSIFPYPVGSPLGIGWNNPLWTLGFEFAAYVAILVIVKVFKSTQMLAVIFCTIALGFVHNSTPFGALFNSGARLGIMFAFGIIVGHVMYSTFKFSMFTALSLSVFAFTLLSGDRIMIYAFLTSSAVLTFALILPPIHMPWKGDFSYGVYIWHWPVYQIILIYLYPAFSISIIQFVSLITTIFVAVLSFYGIEKHWLLHARRFNP
jgi:peptidoglycan/LPS O-acetylase OafA/YrhL